MVDMLEKGMFVFEADNADFKVSDKRRYDLMLRVGG